MNSRFYDVLVAKEYETKQNGIAVKKTAWNRIGRAWASKSGESLSFEIYMFANQRYVVQLKDKNNDQEASHE